jgi:hypothetical protein
MPPSRRTTTQRKADTLAKLHERGADTWVATASPAGVAHLVPLSYAWDGSRVVIATEARLLTARNIAGSGRARLGFGPTRDVVIIDVELDRSLELPDVTPDLADLYAEQSGWDPREESEPYVYMLLRPIRIQAWRESNELSGRTIMQDGAWVD